MGADRGSTSVIPEPGPPICPPLNSCRAARTIDLTLGRKVPIGPVVSNKDGAGSRHDVLWKIGAWFTRSGAGDYDRVVGAALERFAVSLGAHSANIWEVDLAGLDAQVYHRWASGPDTDLGAGAEIAVNSRVVEELTVAGGAMVLSDALLVGAEKAAQRGWTDGQSGVAVISQDESSATAIVVGASSGNWGAHEVDMLRGFATLLRQFDRRVADERRLQLRLDLDMLVVAGSTGLLAAGFGDCESVVDEVLTDLRDVLSARLIAVVCMAQGQPDIEMVVVSSANPVDEALLRFSGSDYAPLPGIAGETLREVLERQQEFELVPALAALAGDDFVDEAGLTDAHRSAVLMPASAKGGDTTSVLVIRDGTDAWLPEELDATKTVASLIAQARIRAAAEERSEFRLEALEVLSSATGALIGVGPDDFDVTVREVLRSVGVFLGIDSLTTWHVKRSDRTYVIRCWWIDGADPVGGFDTTIAWGESSAFDRVRISAVTDIDGPAEPSVGDCSSVVVPTGDDQVEGFLVASQWSARTWHSDAVALLESLSRTIRQAEVRVAAQTYSSAAFGSAPVGVVLCDSERRLVTCNRAFVEFIGAGSPDELIGRSPDEITVNHIDDQDWKRNDDLVESEVAFRRIDGTHVWGHVRVTRVDGIIQGEWMWLVHIENITQRRRALNLLRFQATHDDLTGLLNRRALSRQIDQLLGDPGCSSIAVLLLDLDRFKVINDSLGHERGDELLVVISDRIRLSVRPGDYVARLGGDEFAVIAGGSVDLDSAQRLSERLLRIIGEPVSLGSQVIYPSASIGIAIADGESDSSELMRRADIAMYRAKFEGRSRHEVFDEDLRHQVVVRMDTEVGLRGALRNGELTVHYQPEFMLADGSVLGAEALVRWQHPDRGLLAAGVFIEVAEEAGLLVEIGEFVLREACLEASTWPRVGRLPVVAVNLAAAQIQRVETVDLVRSVLLEVGLAASQLCLEITESAMMRDPIRSERVLGMLKDLGVKLAVDDFGTGFSSLAYLKRFPVDILKIDQSFISDLGVDRDNEKFVNSILRLADTLGLEVIAEGVETEHQAEVLKALGCQIVQGYLYARPAPAEEMRARLV